MNDVKRYSPAEIRRAGLTTITAHSACEGTAPNSREHILAAIASGAEYIEIDVRYDGEQLYLSHDEPESSAACVKFETLLSLIAPYPTLFVNCDVKTDGLLEMICAAAKRYNMGHRVLFTGQCNHRSEECKVLGADLWHSLWRLKNADTEEGIKQLNEAQIREAVAYCKKTNCPYINLDKRIVTAENLAFVKENGLDYSVWTADDEDLIRFLLTHRVANITTRKPRLALKLRDEIQGSPESRGLLPDGSIEKIIRDGAKIMLEADAHRLHVKQKAGTANFVTEYDVRTQHYLEQKLKEVIPECAFLAEEEGESDNPVGDGYTFVIDPIDGTTNFMLGRRASCISVALLKNKKPVYGAIFDPYSNRYYAAHAGGGAYCNHRKIAVSDREPAVGIASLGTSPYNRDTMAKPVTDITYGLLMNFGDIRRIGSAALELCAVACGELDVYCEPILSPWDFAAGKLILCEAGGVATDFKGAELPFDAPSSVLATTPASFETALSVVKGKI